MTANGWITVTAAAAMLATVAGCATPMQMTGPEATLPKDDGSPEFLDRVSSSENVTENDALRGLLMLLDGKDESGTFAKRVESLRAREIVSGKWDYRADRPLTRGKLAYMVYQACKLDGGVILTLTGPSQRYCLRELQFRGFMASGVMYSPVSGMEYIAVVTRADTYLETGELPNVLSTEMMP